jgi:GTPase SAR1 family protein
VFYRYLNGIIFVSVCTDRASFDQVQLWMREIEKPGVAQVCSLLVGNKTDVTDGRVVRNAEGAEFFWTLFIPMLNNPKPSQCV